MPNFEKNRSTAFQRSTDAKERPAHNRTGRQKTLPAPSSAERTCNADLETRRRQSVRLSAYDSPLPGTDSGRGESFLPDKRISAVAAQCLPDTRASYPTPTRISAPQIRPDRRATPRCGIRCIPTRLRWIFSSRHSSATKSAARQSLSGPAPFGREAAGRSEPATAPPRSPRRAAPRGRTPAHGRSARPEARATRSPSRVCRRSPTPPARRRPALFRRRPHARGRSARTRAVRRDTPRTPHRAASPARNARPESGCRRATSPRPSVARTRRRASRRRTDRPPRSGSRRRRRAATSSREDRQRRNRSRGTAHR